MSPAAPLGKFSTAWIEGTALMEVRCRGHIDGQAHLELQLGTSLHGADDQRDAAMTVDGASLSEWRMASQPVLTAIGQALATEGFTPAS